MQSVLTFGKVSGDTKEFLVLRHALLLVNDNVVAHETKETISVHRRRHGRNTWAFLHESVLQKVLELLFKIVVLKVVNYANMVNEATTRA